MHHNDEEKAIWEKVMAESEFYPESEFENVINMPDVYLVEGYQYKCICKSDEDFLKFINKFDDNEAFLEDGYIDYLLDDGRLLSEVDQCDDDYDDIYPEKIDIVGKRFSTNEFMNPERYIQVQKGSWYSYDPTKIRV